MEQGEGAFGTAAIPTVHTIVSFTRLSTKCTRIVDLVMCRYPMGSVRREIA